MIRSIFCPKQGEPCYNLSLAELAQSLHDPKGLVWVSLEQPTDDEVRQVLEDTFHFHPLAIEDTQSVGYQAPKVDDFGDYLFIIAQALRPNSFFQELETMELNLFLGPNYLVTSYQSPEMPPVQEVWKRLQRDERLIENGADFLCHAVLDDMVDAYMPVIDAMDEEIDQLEDMVLLRPHPSILQRILHLKHSTLTLRRIILPQREVMNRLSRDDLRLIADHNRIYFRDIYDHLVRIHDLGETVRDVIAGTLDTYLSSSSNRLNEVMKALTVVSTIFLPLSFLAGVYGMNFEFMPELHWQYGYPMTWLVFLAVPAIMLWYFRYKGWL